MCVLGESYIQRKTRKAVCGERPSWQRLCQVHCPVVAPPSPSLGCGCQQERVKGNVNQLCFVWSRKSDGKGKKQDHKVLQWVGDGWRARQPSTTRDAAPPQSHPHLPPASHVLKKNNKTKAAKKNNNWRFLSTMCHERKSESLISVTSTCSESLYALSQSTRHLLVASIRAYIKLSERSLLVLTTFVTIINKCTV